VIIAGDENEDYYVAIIDVTKVNSYKFLSVKDFIGEIIWLENLEKFYLVSKKTLNFNLLKQIPKETNFLKRKHTKGVCQSRI